LIIGSAFLELRRRQSFLSLVLSRVLLSNESLDGTTIVVRAGVSNAFDACAALTAFQDNTSGGSFACQLMISLRVCLSIFPCVPLLKPASVFVADDGPENTEKFNFICLSGVVEAGLSC